MMQQQTEEPSTTTSSNNVDAKILKDLNTVTEQINLCTSILLSSDYDPNTNLYTNEPLLTIIGFLEACVPRMIELVEAGTGQGGGGGGGGSMVFANEETLFKCLSVNDDLCQVLKGVEDPSLLQKNTNNVVVGGVVDEGGVGVSGSASASASASASSSMEDVDVDFNAFGIDDETTPNTVFSSTTSGGGDQQQQQQQQGKTTGIEDTLGELLAAPTTSTTIPTNNNNDGGGVGVGVVGQKKDDEFDDFFGERMAGGQKF